MAEDLKEGARIRIVLEGVTEDEWSDVGNRYDYGVVLFDDGTRGMYFENLPVSAVEVIPEPLKPGLYYYPEVGNGQITGVYKLDDDGEWYDNTLSPRSLPDYILNALVPLVQGER